MVLFTDGNEEIEKEFQEFAVDYKHKIDFLLVRTNIDEYDQYLTQMKSEKIT